MGADGADAVPQLAEAMRGTNIVLCRLAAKALSSVGPPALATLISHLQHSDPFVRGESALALGWMGAVARSSVPFLAQVVRGPKGYTPRPTPPTGNISSSNTATPPSNNPDVLTSEENCRIYAAQALGRIGPPAAGALSDLKEVTRHGSDALRLAAQQAIRQIQGG
jgi:HEAT repeat protein